jgi:hypothetical protein
MTARPAGGLFGGNRADAGGEHLHSLFEISSDESSPAVG